MGDSSGGSMRAGVLFGLVAYASWGLVPLYFHQIKHVPATEILAHRVVASAVLLAFVAAVSGFWRDVLRVFSNRRLVAVMALSAALLAGNWLLYIYATVTHRVSEASLGYYMMPLVNAVLATAVLGERLRPAHYPALALVGLGVAMPFVIEGDFTWLAVALPVTFACYGLVRKLAPVDSLTGLTVETLVMVVPAAGFLAFRGANGSGAFGPDWNLNALLMASGVVTVIPLLTFGLSVRRMPLLANSFIQFVSPTIQILIAVFWIGESMGADRWAALGCVWAAVVIFLGDSLAQMRAKRRPAPVAIAPPTPPSAPAAGGHRPGDVVEVPRSVVLHFRPVRQVNYAPHAPE